MRHERCVFWVLRPPPLHPDPMIDEPQDDVRLSTVAAQFLEESISTQQQYHFLAPAYSGAGAGVCSWCGVM